MDSFLSCFSFSEFFSFVFFLLLYLLSSLSYFSFFLIFFVSFLRAQVPLFLKGLPVAKLCAWGFSFWYLFVRYLHDFACPGRRVPSGDRKSPGRSRVPAQDMEMEAA